MIFDGFTFFNEIDMLELRLETMWDYVDKFIIVESRKSFTNIDKELNYEKNKDKFKKYWGKIEYIVIDEFPTECKNAWDREHYQRDAIYQGIKNASPNDILLISDVDEIISPYGVRRAEKILKKKPQEVLRLELLNCWYFLNYVDYKLFFLGAPVAYTFGKKDNANKNLLPQAARDWKKCENVQCAGWHFTYMGGMDIIKNKIRSFSHQEYNTDEWLDDERIMEMIKSGKDLFNREIAEFGSLPVGYFMPKPVRKNTLKYKKYLCNLNPMPLKKKLRLRVKYVCETTWLRYIYHMFR